MASILSFSPYQYLPLFAKVAIERLDGASELRTADSLDFLLDAYARTYGLECDSHTRYGDGEFSEGIRRAARAVSS